jgi:hypothetical protein
LDQIKREYGKYVIKKFSFKDKKKNYICRSWNYR